MRLNQYVMYTKYLLRGQEEGVFHIYFPGSLHCNCETSGADPRQLFYQMC